MLHSQISRIFDLAKICLAKISPIKVDKLKEFPYNYIPSNAKVFQPSIDELGS